MKNRHLYYWQIFGLVACALPCLALCKAWAEPAAPALLRVPVFFVTDRNLEMESKDKGASFGPHRKHIGDCQHDPFMGFGYCVVKNEVGKPLSAELTARGWAAASATDKEGETLVRTIEANDFTSAQATFYSQLRDAAGKTPRKEIVLFAHGYKNSFDAALRTAGRFSYSYESPVVLYSWPSVAKLRSYNSDENNNEWSQEHFNDVALKLQEICDTEPQLKLRLFAHSMGTRLIVRGMPFLCGKTFIKEVALVCPDVDGGLVKHYARRYLAEKGTTTVRLYMSQRDKALALSQMVHGGYARFGECADSLATLAKTAFQGTSKSTSIAAENDSPESEALKGLKKRMQTIDFTDLDCGVIGHKIPVDVMCNMSYSNAPGNELKLVEQRSGARSKTSQALSKLTKLQTASSQSADNCLRVVRTNKSVSNL